MAVQIRHLDFWNLIYNAGVAVTNNVVDKVSNIFKRKALDHDVEEVSVKKMRTPPFHDAHEISQDVLIVCNKSGQLVTRNALSPIFDANATKINIELRDLIGRGTYGSVFKGSMRTNTSEKENISTIAVKTPSNENGAIESLLKESYLSSLAAMAPNVNGGAYLFQSQSQFYLLQKLFVRDGHSFSFSSSKIISQKNTLSIFGDVLRGGHALTELGIYHVDLKPQNVLVDSFNQLHLSDLGGACFFPPAERITDELVLKQIEFLSDRDKVHLKPLLDKFDSLEFHEKLFILMYVQTQGALKIYSTKFTSNNSLENKINSLLYTFYTELSKPTHDQAEIINNYNRLRSLLECLMVHQLAVTALTMSSQALYEDLTKNRKEGEYTSTGTNPLSKVGIAQILKAVKVTDPRVLNLFFKMIDSEQNPITTTQCLNSFSRLKRKR